MKVRDIKHLETISNIMQHPDYYGIWLMAYKNGQPDTLGGKRVTHVHVHDHINKVGMESMMDNSMTETCEFSDLHFNIINIASQSVDTETVAQMESITDRMINGNVLPECLNEETLVLLEYMDPFGFDLWDIISGMLPDYHSVGWNTYPGMAGEPMEVFEYIVDGETQEDHTSFINIFECNDEAREFLKSLTPTTTVQELSFEEINNYIK